jgi:hypothetical protein
MSTRGRDLSNFWSNAVFFFFFYPIENLRELAFVLAGRNTTIAPSDGPKYRDLCLQLWQTPEHHVWLSAAMLRRLMADPDSLDEATEQFVANKLCDDLQLPRKGNEEVVKHVAAVAQLMPDEAWLDAGYLWQTFLETAVEELYLPDAKLPDPPLPMHGWTKASELADDVGQLFIDAMGKPWTTDLENRLREFVKDPSFGWISGVRDAARLSAALRHNVPSAAPADDKNPFADDENPFADDKPTALKHNVPSAKPPELG